MKEMHNQRSHSVKSCMSKQSENFTFLLWVSFASLLVSKASDLGNKQNVLKL